MPTHHKCLTVASMMLYKAGDNLYPRQRDKCRPGRVRCAFRAVASLSTIKSAQAGAGGQAATSSPESMSPKQMETQRREFEALQTVVLALARQVDELMERIRQLEEKKR